MQLLTRFIRFVLAVPFMVAGLGLGLFGITGFFLGHTSYATAFVIIALLLLAIAGGILPRGADMSVLLLGDGNPRVSLGEMAQQPPSRRVLPRSWELSSQKTYQKENYPT